MCQQALMDEQSQLGKGIAMASATRQLAILSIAADSACMPELQACSFRADVEPSDDAAGLTVA